MASNASLVVEVWCAGGRRRQQVDCSPAAPAHDGLMAASSARGWMLVWHHGCLLPACSLPCAPILLRDQILEEQESGGATAELQKCGKHSYF